MDDEFIEFECGSCKEPVRTAWSSQSLLNGPYNLMGEVFFHEGECTDKYLQEFKGALDGR